VLVKNRDEQASEGFKRVGAKSRRRGFFGDLRLAAIFWVVVLAGLGLVLGFRL